MPLYGMPERAPAGLGGVTYGKPYLFCLMPYSQSGMLERPTHIVRRKTHAMAHVAGLVFDIGRGRRRREGHYACDERCYHKGSPAPVECGPGPVSCHIVH